MASSVIWAEKYRPYEFSSLIYNTDIEKKLHKLITNDDFPHLLFYGPNGAGKRTLIKCVLNELFGEGSHKMKSEIKEFEATASTTVECVVYSSTYHVEISPSETDRYDRVVVNSIIKDLAGTASLNVDSDRKFDWKVIVIHELDKLSKEAQSGLRRTMEKYMANCRIIFNCESLSKVMAPLKSRCVQIRVPAPKISDIEDTLQQISKFEGFSCNDELARKIAVLCKGNMRKGIMILQGLKANYPSLSASTKVQKPGYEDTISDIADDIVREQTPKQLKLIRSKFYELITKGISADLIICLLTKYLLDRIDDGAKIKLVSESVNCDLRCQLGSKEIIHLEAFAAISMMIVRESRP